MIVLDRDSSESPTYGEQEGSAYNGHFGCTCYHPLFMFNQFADVERCVRRPGNVHSADDWRVVLEPVIRALPGQREASLFPGRRSFRQPRDITSFLKPRASATRSGLPANRVFQDRSGYLLKQPVGRPPHEVRRYFVSSAIGRRAGISRVTSWPRSKWHPGE